MSTHMHFRRLLPAVLLAASALVSGCATDHGSTEPAGLHAGDSPSAHRDPDGAELPKGVVEPGTQQTVGDGSWSVTLQRLEQLPASTVPNVPAGSSAFQMRMTVTNRQPQIAAAPQISVIARYGALGRQATEVTGSASVSLMGDEPLRVRPDGTVSQDVRLVLPDQAQGQPVTVTVEATPQGLAQPDLLFFESALPGRPVTSSQPQGPRGGGSQQAVTPLGQWNDGVRLSPVSVTGQGSSRSAHLELSVANRTGDPLRGLGTTLRVLTGQNLHLAATVRPVYGYHDAAIAPHRTATQSVAFRVPEASVGGPVTIEAVDADGSRITFEGRLG
jgi:hypothetical protein